MKALFIIQGHGRGHLTQSLALAQVLRRQGHEIASAMVGGARYFPVPDFVRNGLHCDISTFESLEMIPTAGEHSIDWASTVVTNMNRSRRFRQSIEQIQFEVRRHRPDVVINFYEPLAALAKSLGAWPVPTVSIAHQFMFLHGSYIFPERARARKHVLRGYSRLVASGSDVVLALSTRADEEAMGGKLQVVPPLLRDSVLNASGSRDDDSLLVYTNRSQHLEQIVRWCRENPRHRVNFFWNNPDYGAEWSPLPSLTFHQLHGEKFMQMMNRCRGMATSAGFETMCESMYMGKPILMVPWPGQFEQACNVSDVESHGAGIGSDALDLDRLVTYCLDYTWDNTAFRSWVAAAGETITAAVEGAVSDHSSKYALRG